MRSSFFQNQLVTPLRICLVAACLWTMCNIAHGQDAPAAPASPAKAIVMKLHTLKDPGMNGMNSHTVLAPDGWTVEGGAFWPPPALFNILPSQEIKVVAPNGTTVKIGPTLGAADFHPSPMAVQQFGARRPPEGGVDNGNPIIHVPQDPDEWKSWMEAKSIPMTFKGATDIRVESAVVVPELTQLVQRQLEPIRQQQAAQNAGGMAMAGRSACDGVVMAIGASFDHNGKRWDVLSLIGATYISLDGQVGRQLWWTIEPSCYFLAPAGELDAAMPVLMTIAYSVRPTQEWAQMKSDHSRKMNQIAAKGAADRSNIIAKNHGEIMKIINDTGRDRAASQDRIHHQVINTIRGVEDYTPAGGGTGASVQLPNNYEHVYTNGSGDYLLTNDSGYNPNQDANVNNRTWETMKVAR